MNSALPISANLLPTSSFVHLINLKLTRDNYLLWKAQSFPYLTSQQLMGYVKGSILCPDKMITETIASGTQQVPTPTYQAWLQQDYLILNALFSSLSEGVLSHVFFLATSHEFLKVKNLANTFALIGQPLHDEEIIVYMLAGLDTEFDSLVTSINIRSNSISLSDLYVYMLVFELRMAHNNTSFRDVDPAINNVYCNNSAGKSLNRERGRAKGGQLHGTSSGNEQNSNDSHTLC
ncbi:uncharacterized protein LOC120277774 [Dioscorea cayenensis subsp. rotundata]|uniref:Uncharacterized protein LOC120277774 n=1 Tax=Dioscorea cayennensis subsp. rotundata TaxID=55577 RepID=A0AB40CKE2_DIOCR|nr:uncharacterized protein LOC120277774 [Dioscorea cayenensis subsp. rotundata]